MNHSIRVQLHNQDCSVGGPVELTIEKEGENPWEIFSADVLSILHDGLSRKFEYCTYSMDGKSFYLLSAGCIKGLRSGDCIKLYTKVIIECSRPIIESQVINHSLSSEVLLPTITKSNTYSQPNVESLPSQDLAPQVSSPYIVIAASDIEDAIQKSNLRVRSAMKHKQMHQKQS